MKRIILLLALVSLIFAGCARNETKISEDKAKEIALSNAGLSNEDVTFIKTEKEYDDGKTIYEVEFYSKDNREFDYEIDADTGDILSFDSDAENYIASSGAASQNPPQQEETITEDKVKEIALAKVPGATAENIREFKKDFDDGREEYEGKIIYNKAEYEFEIDAKTGEIIKWESDSVFD